jgi:hypothetical protein
VFLDFRGVGLELIEPPADAEPPPDRHWAGRAQIACALGSADAVDHVSAHLAAAGHPVMKPPHRSREDHYHAVVLDPDCNHIELTVLRRRSLDPSNRPSSSVRPALSGKPPRATTRQSSYCGKGVRPAFPAGLAGCGLTPGSL